jgi:hypothetical protein
MLRNLVIALLVANGLFFAWTRGWLAPGFAPPNAGQREPERVAAQLHPEAIVVLPAKAASAAITAARVAAQVCLEAGPFTEAALPAALAALTAAQLPEASWQREPVPPPPLWLVYIARGADAEVQRARGEVLRKLGLTFEVLGDTPPELAKGFALSRHATQSEAEVALAAAAASAASAAPIARGLRVVSLPAPPVQVWLKAPQVDAEQQEKLKGLSGDAVAGGFKACVARP